MLLMLNTNKVRLLIVNIIDLHALFSDLQYEMDEFWDYLKLKPHSVTVHHVLHKAFNSTPKF